MEITLEQIDLIRKRARVSYKEAKEALEHCEGNMVEALAYLEDNGKIKPEKEEANGSSFSSKIKKTVKHLHSISFSITKKDKVILDIPLTLAIILAVIAFPLFILLLALAIISSCKIKLINSNGEDCGINKDIDKITNKINEFTSQAK
jgi:hypothetical protein